MKQRRDMHGLMNALIGVLIALIAGFYYSELPVPVVVTMIVASSFLVIREIWISGGSVRWSTVEKS